MIWICPSLLECIYLDENSTNDQAMPSVVSCERSPLLSRGYMLK